MSIMIPVWALVGAVSQDTAAHVNSINAGLTLYPDDAQCTGRLGTPIAAAQKNGVYIVGNPQRDENGFGFVKMYDAEGNNYLAGKLEHSSDSFIGQNTVLLEKEVGYLCDDGLIGEAVAISEMGNDIAFTCLEASGTYLFVATFIDGKYRFIDPIYILQYVIRDVVFSGDGNHLFYSFLNEVVHLKKTTSCSNPIECWNIENSLDGVSSLFDNIEPYSSALAVSWDGNTLMVAHKTAINCVGGDETIIPDSQGAIYILTRADNNAPWEKQTVYQGDDIGLGHNIAISADGSTYAYTMYGYSDANSDVTGRLTVCKNGNCDHHNGASLSTMQYGLAISHDGSTILAASVDVLKKIYEFKFEDSSLVFVRLLDTETAGATFGTGVACLNPVCTKVVVADGPNIQQFSSSPLRKLIDEGCQVNLVYVNCVSNDDLAGETLPSYRPTSCDGFNQKFTVRECNGLGGTIPAWIFELPLESKLSLSGIDLIGSIPTEIGTLENIKEIYLVENKLSGPLPAEIGKLSNVEIFFFQTNNLIGTLPAEIFETGKLTDINGYDNNLIISIPKEIGMSTNLIEFSFSDNDFTGSIPTEIGRLSKLTDFIISNKERSFSDTTGISGEIPTEIGTMADLQKVDLSGHFLTGAIPPQIGQLSKLTEISLHSNDLNGPIPPEIVQLTLLERLEIRQNSITGAIPTQLEALTNIERFDVLGNFLTGNVPKFQSEVLNYCQITDNCFVGSMESRCENINEQRSPNNCRIIDNLPPGAPPPPPPVGPLPPGPSPPGRPSPPPPPPTDGGSSTLSGGAIAGIVGGSVALVGGGLILYSINLKTCKLTIFNRVDTETSTPLF